MDNIIDDAQPVHRNVMNAPSVGGGGLTIKGGLVGVGGLGRAKEESSL